MEKKDWQPTLQLYGTFILLLCHPFDCISENRFQRALDFSFAYPFQYGGKMAAFAASSQPKIWTLIYHFTIKILDDN